MGCVCCKFVPGFKKGNDKINDGDSKTPTFSAIQKKHIKAGRQAFRHNMGEIGIAGLLGYVWL